MHNNVMTPIYMNVVFKRISLSSKMKLRYNLLFVYPLCLCKTFMIYDLVIFHKTCMAITLFLMYFYFNPRPTQINPSIKTLTVIPNGPADVAGQACFSGAAATLVSYLIPENAAKYHAMPKEAGMSRLMGGIHYRVDCEVGLQVGNNVGNYAVQRAQADGGN